MKKLYLILFLFLMCGLSSLTVSAQPLTESALPRFVLSLPFPNACNSSERKQSLLVVKDLQIYQCINGKYVASGGVLSRNLDASQYPSLASAISTIGANQRTFNINTPLTCNSTLTIPATLALEFTNSGKIVKASGCNLTVASVILASKVQIFEGFDKTNLKLNGANDYYYFEWTGAKGDYGKVTPPTDDWAAIQLLYDVVEFPVSGSIYQKGSGTFKFAAKTYYSSKTINIRAAGNTEGSGGFKGSKIVFPQNVRGLIFEAFSTQEDGSGGFLVTGKSSGGSKLTNLSVEALQQNTTAFSENWQPTNTVNLAGDRITVVTGTPFDSQRSAPPATTVTIGRSHWLLAKPLPDENGNGIPYEVADNIATRLQPYRSSACGDPKPAGGSNCQVAAGATSDIIHVTNATLEPYWIGMKVKILGNPTIYRISEIPPNYNNSDPTSVRIEDRYYFRVVRDSDGAVAAIPDFFGEIEVFGFVAGGANNGRAVRLNQFHAIESRVQTYIENVTVEGFNGNAFQYNSCQTSADVGNQPNTNNSTFIKNISYTTAGHGIYLCGTNSNTSTFLNSDISNTGGAGYYDTSFLGNTVIGLHVSGNAGGSYVTSGGVNGTNFFNNYTEGGAPCSVLSQYNLWFGGNTCFSPLNQGAVMGAGGNGAFAISKIAMTSPDGTRYYLSINNAGAFVATPY